MERLARTEIGRIVAVWLVAVVLTASAILIMPTDSSGTHPDPAGDFDPVRAELQRRAAISAQQPGGADFLLSDLR